MKIIEATTTEPMPYGLLSVADVTDDARTGVSGFRVWGQLCGLAVAALPAECPPAEADKEDTATAEQIDSEQDRKSVV